MSFWLTIVPTMVFLTERGFIKVEVALVKGKKVHDKRDKMGEKETKKNLKNILIGFLNDSPKITLQHL